MSGLEKQYREVYYNANLRTHEKKCKEMFDHIISGTETYMRMDKNPFEEPGCSYVRASLLTKEILQYDQESAELLSTPDGIDKYRPYFVSFVINMDSVNKGNLERLHDEWYVCKYVASDELIDESGISFSGYLELGASPINYLDGKLLVFNDKSMSQTVLQQINKAYDISMFHLTDNATIQMYLNQAWKNERPKTVDIYNIGHGNADYISGEKSKILYDVGYNYRQYPSYQNTHFLRAKKAIRRLDPDCVILSHWDMDHIIGCAYAKLKMFSVKWIAPCFREKENVSTNAMRLANYLNVRKNLCLVDRDRPGMIASITCPKGLTMKLWLGGGKSRINQKNREGLMIEIGEWGDTNHCCHTLLTGDVPYNCMDYSIAHSVFTFMHVPHHCSKMELNVLQKMSGKGKLAVISTNRRKASQKLNCDDDHCKELWQKYEYVMTTLDHPIHNDEANLAVCLNLYNGSWNVR